eukprot:CAMPEP_0183356088 /NCGR_PEP_ID=MMETSP0164_2-20130417/43042_1 /TAXON_ID=221442 /ORGANISM="Coccolithus pelagicus ssp braarudi, Strain PLY182g" /LENGTH=43 /DNA_ID= /DNA_START= /DNA_END= /DNA_ORIENTATION=
MASSLPVVHGVAVAAPASSVAGTVPNESYISALAAKGYPRGLS